MLSPKVKICGLTNLADATGAVEAGADYLGFILYPPSKRSVSAADVRHIAGQLRQRPACPVLVGVFVDETAEEMARILDFCGLDLAQLSGDEPAALVGDPASPLYGRSYKALRPTSMGEAEADADWYLPPEPDPRQPRLLIDAYHPNLRGGTGLTADWSIAAHLARRLPGLMLAGGLTPDNVAEAVAQVKPYAVDVASGVERSPGIKDLARVRAFITAAHHPRRA